MNKTLSDLLHRKSFLASIVILGLFAVLAAAAPVITPYSNPYLPSQARVAAPYAVPAWATVFPQYRNLPPNQNLILSTFRSEGGKVTEFNSTFLEVTVPPSGVVNVTFPVNWNYKPPYSFAVSFQLVPPKGYYILNVLIGQGNRTFWLYSVVPKDYAIPPQVGVPSTPSTIFLSSALLSASNSPYVSTLSPTQQALSGIYLPIYVFRSPGTYNLTLSLNNEGSTPQVFVFSKPTFSDKGYAYGRLGTDDNGASVFAEFVLGARFDLFIGLVASAMILAIGLVLGMLAGYVGGKVDLSLNAFTDFFLLLPGLPLLITVETILVVSGAIVRVSLATVIVLLIALLSWPGTMKIIRSQTLSLRSRTFVESSKALGAGNFRIMMRHILPNLAGILFAQLAYDVPGVILAESGLDFLGLGIRSFPTWGNMLGYATTAASTANSFAWWWVLPPGIGIVVLSLGFFYFGSALLDVLSPYRLRGE
ncbi:peptide transporter [Sulfodiicoccus acidiphilus]|uniref:Peptide transporter n=1 Tax=Sulfodiicoccus acidiphilus TaxID=1670455 RepID=A0A348B2F5_9CREN|nr:ABC transporter permease [Sulfodiicoccus acidiphilus]BBD72357.1 peptide transporter [Sulfodiicoccus acidiphilus]GGT90061.1 peptide transporter [Sulfodiicoccus acidiphilus]